MSQGCELIHGYFYAMRKWYFNCQSWLNIEIVIGRGIVDHISWTDSSLFMMFPLPGSSQNRPRQKKAPSLCIHFSTSDVHSCSWISAFLVQHSIQFYLYSTFYNKIVSRCFTESKTQSQNPQVGTVARKNSLLTGRNLEQDPAYREEPSCWESAG